MLVANHATLLYLFDAFATACHMRSNVVTFDRFPTLEMKLDFKDTDIVSSAHAIKEAKKAKVSSYIRHIDLLI
jgi:hypothetical protein